MKAEMTDPYSSLMFVWAYLIEQGRVTDGNWSYYGSGWSHPDEYKYDENRKDRVLDLRLRDIRAQIKEFGVDWTRTQAPVGSKNSIFEGTFHPASSVEALLGKLYIKGIDEPYLIGISNADTRFTDYLTLLAQMAADRQRIKDILGE